MKVDRGKSSGGGGPASSGVKKSGGSAPSGAPAFIDAVKAAESKIVNEDLDLLIKQVEEQADVLVKKRTDTELKKYQKLVSDFMKKVVEDGFGVAEVQSIKMDGKFYVISRRVEEKLLQLAEQLADRTADANALAATTSEIRGLLLDLRI